VHGIADQLPGQTVRELARLLCHGGEGAPRFVQGKLSNVLVPVAKLEPGKPDIEKSLTQPSVAEASNELLKKDSARQQPGAPSGFYQTQQKSDSTIANASPSAITEPTDTENAELGIALNDYLLERLQLTERDSLYEAAKISLRRKRDDRGVDLYEMYWADLSRLGTGSLLALSTLYQLFFHLTTLSADVVDQISLSMNGGRAWHWLQRLHAWMAWLMKGPAVILQLSMLLIVLFGATQLVPREQQANVLAVAYGAGAIVLTILAGLAWLHAKSSLTKWLNPTLLLLATVCCVGLSITVFLTDLWLAWLYFGSCALATELLGAYLIDRYSKVARGVFVAGHLICGGTVVALCAMSWQVRSYVSTVYEWMMTAALHVFELQLAAMLVVWTIFIIVELIALTLGLWLQRRGDRMVKDSMHTARLSLVVSTGLFTVLSLVLWSVISYVAGKALSDLGYDALIFGGEGYWSSAAFFLDARVQALGGFFTPLVVASGLFAIAGMMVLAPSLLEELAPGRNVDASGVRSGAAAWSNRLGCWMGNWMRRLDRALMVIVPVGAIGGGLLFLAFVFQEFALTWSGFDRFAAWLASWLVYFQGESLVAAGKWLAGGALTIAALGSRFTKTFGRLRVVIDAILDVDNYFGDPPNRQPPRARIFSRYASLLTYLKDANYSRIVIVAHSQGTVISAELLRYLHVKDRLQEFAGTIPLALVTVGSPLRDLYATRFPLLYRWMGSNAEGFASATPRAADIGACEWVNVCRSGDYVGRFIWTPASDAARFDVATVDANDKVVAQRAGDRTEFCLGAGAHTHYFSNDALALAVEIDRLITGIAVKTSAQMNITPRSELYGTATMTVVNPQGTYE
jgi:hypothetical protein